MILPEALPFTGNQDAYSTHVTAPP
jgi:hypothetical protein